MRSGPPNSVVLGRAYLKKVCEILELPPEHVGKITVHFDLDDFVWAEVRMIPPREFVDRVVKLVEDAKNGVPPMRDDQ